MTLGGDTMKNQPIIDISGAVIPTPDLVPTPNEESYQSNNQTNGTVFNASATKFINDIDLDKLELPDIDWIVEGLIPQDGLTLLCGKQKSGKSFGLLQLAECVARGLPFLNRNTKQGEVLNLALEDNHRRLKRRKRNVREALSIDDISPLNHSLTRKDVRRIDDGGMDIIKHWVDNVAKNPRLIIIDTWAKFAPPSKGFGNAYEVDVKAISPLQEYCGERNIGIICVMHLNQNPATDDWMDAIQGSSGLPATADQIMCFRKPRGKNVDAELLTDGRDGEPVEEAIKFENQIWTSMGDKKTYAKTRAREEIIETANVLEKYRILEGTHRGWKPMELMRQKYNLEEGDKVDKAESMRIYQILKTMLEENDIEKHTDYYCLPVQYMRFNCPEDFPILPEMKTKKKTKKVASREPSTVAEIFEAVKGYKIEDIGKKKDNY